MRPTTRPPGPTVSCTSLSSPALTKAPRSCCSTVASDAADAAGGWAPGEGVRVDDDATGLSPCVLEACVVADEGWLWPLLNETFMPLANSEYFTWFKLPRA